MKLHVRIPQSSVQKHFTATRQQQCEEFFDPAFSPLLQSDDVLHLLNVTTFMEADVFISLSLSLFLN